MKGKQLTKMFTVAATTMIFSMSLSVIAMAEEDTVFDKYDVNAICDEIEAKILDTMDTASKDEQYQIYLTNIPGTNGMTVDEARQISDYFYYEYGQYYSLCLTTIYTYSDTEFACFGIIYKMDGNECQEYLDNYDNAIAEFNAAYDLASAPDWTDMEKALYVHDYLTILNSYDETYANHSPYHALVDHCSVCEGYATAYVALCKEVGLEAHYVSSEDMEHAWNAVKLDGQYYLLDATWDDPIHDQFGRSLHNQFIKSSSYFLSAPQGVHCHTPSQTASTWANDYSFTGDMTFADLSNTTYDSSLLDDIGTKICAIDGVWYAMIGDNLKTIDYDTTTKKWVASETPLVTSDETWWAWGSSSSYWPTVHPYIDTYNGKLYYTAPTYITCYDPVSGTTTTEYTLSDTEKSLGYIYGFKIDTDGKASFQLKTSPNDQVVAYTGSFQIDSHTKDDNHDGACDICGTPIDGATSLLGVSCDVNDYIGLNFALAVTDEAKADFLANDAYITITQYTGDDTTATPHAVFDNISFKDLTYDNTTKSFTVPCKVSAKEMSDTLVLTINNGTNTYTEYTYSVQDYLETLKDDSKYGDFVNQLLQYGAFAQLYFEYNTSDLATAVSSYTNISEVTDAIADGGLHKSISCSDPDVSFYGWTLILKSQITIRSYFTIDANCPYASEIPHASGNLYYIDSANTFSPLYYSKNYNVVFGGCNISYSVYDYIYNMVQKDSCSTELKDLLVSMYYLSEEAKQL